MTPAVETSLGIVAYLALFFGVGLAFVFFNLLLGRFLRPADPHEEKTEIYECGEPTIGSSFVQFDLRFYVVALLFIIFDVEVAFFFPWATVFGKSVNMMDDSFPVAVSAADGNGATLTPEAKALYQELGVRKPAAPTVVPRSLVAEYERKIGAGTASQPIATAEQAEVVSKEGSRQLAFITIFDIGVFFAVLLVGFAYVWRRGDLNWVRAVERPEQQRSDRAPPESAHEGQPVLSA